MFFKNWLSYLYQGSISQFLSLYDQYFYALLKQTTVFSLFILSFSLNFFNIIFNFVCSPESRPYTKAAIGYPGYVVFPKAERLHWHKETLSFKISFGDVVIKPKNGSQRTRNGSSRLIKGCRPTSCTVNYDFPYFPNVNRKKWPLSTRTLYWK